MFDIGFSELIVIGIVTLVVVGPERMPRVARTAGLLLGRVQRYVNGVKADISREIQLDELKRLLESNPELRNVMKGVDEVIEGEVVRDALTEAPSE